MHKVHSCHQSKHYALHLAKQQLLCSSGPPIFDPYYLTSLTIPVSNNEPAKLPISLVTAQCCAMMQLLILKDNTLGCSQTEHFCTLCHALVRVAMGPCSVLGNEQPTRAPFAPSSSGPDGRPWIRHPRHRATWFAERNGRWPLPPAAQRSAPRASQGGPKGQRESIGRSSATT